ncbi:MAG: hypothetical protein O7G84_01240 [Gammaproteobacteria bacterium]|nr:hypothetical protein [Gammaproteobacteria bacterium]
MANRKDPANLGGTFENDKFPPDDPVLDFEQAAGAHSVVMPERVILALLRSETDRLSNLANVGELRRFFSFFFDPMITEDERESYITSFQRTPPVPILGYPRSSSEFPCMAVVLERDAEDQAALSHYLGQTRAGDPVEQASEFQGSMYEKTYGVYIYATHPDLCLYLYHFAKAVLIGSNVAMQRCGMVETRYDGNELNPQDTYLPENMFVRRLGVTVKSLETVPIFLGVDGQNVQITGIWADDIMVAGVRGGVHPIDPSEEP